MKMGDFDILSIQVREDIQKNAVKYQPMSGLGLWEVGIKEFHMAKSYFVKFLPFWNCLMSPKICFALES